MEPELLEELLTNIQKLQSIMIDVATGESRIQDKEEDYTKLYLKVASQIADLQDDGHKIENPNNFQSLWVWHRHWKPNLNGYASRGAFIHDLYKSVFNEIDIALCQHHVKVTSLEALDHELEISRLEELIAKIEHIKKIMIEVATQRDPTSQIQYEEEDYSKLYREVTLQLGILRELDIHVSNPNEFRSLWQWYSFWQDQLFTRDSRRKHISELYTSVVEPINKALNNHRRKATSSAEFVEDLKRRFNLQTSAHISTSTLISTPQAINNYNLADTNLPEEYIAVQSSPVNLISVWTDENVMNPEIFLEQKDVSPLMIALNQFALKVNVASDRYNVLESADIDSAFLSNLRFDTQSNIFAQGLVAAFRSYPISNQRLNYHPMVKLLEYLRDLAPVYGLNDQSVELFTRLVEKGNENFEALATRSAVGRIESPIGNAIGTGVLIRNNLLLTCNHIFSKSQVQKAWVRFGYKAGTHDSAKDIFELDFISQHSRPDYAFLKIKGQPQQQKAISINNNAILDEGQEIRIIHHPQGKPVVISDLGQIMQVGEDYIDHNVNTDDGSSGAPIFNSQWELIAIHQGKVGIARNSEPGTTGGIPIRAIWNQISSYLD
jgi:S1-C subfamily serine protease